jgi:regulatory protein
VNPSRDLDTALRERALQWLAQREHSRQELRDKLQRWLDAQHTVAALRGRENLPIPREVRPAQAPPPVTDSGRVPTTTPQGLDLVEPLLDTLERAGHLSEQRFVETRIRARVQRHGNRRIEHELRRHGLTAPADTQQALTATEYERALQVWQRKFGAAASAPAEQARQMRFLAGRGFTPETVRRVLADASTGGLPSADPPHDPWDIE